ncbi:MAG: HigA family addiction module antitoxin [Planctomycetota bacterium]
MKRKIPRPHPGEILEKEFMEELGLTAYRLAKCLHIPQQRLSEILRGKRGISADTALRLGRFFGTTTALWMNLQAHFDLETAEERLGRKLRAIIPLARAKRRKLA